MNENLCKDVHFTEQVMCYRDGDYLKAHGWTESTGQTREFPYTPPDGWEYDPAFEDIYGSIGSHGGCTNCFMTLVHLRKLYDETEPAKTPWLLLALLLIGLYIYLRR